MLKASGHSRLWGWFGLSYASFCVLPRIMMHEMPDEWQGKMATLLEEYEAAFPNSPAEKTRVQLVGDNNRLIKWPAWVLNYRYPDAAEIDKARKR